MKKTWKRLCTGFLALATVVTALPTTPVHAESKKYWTESKERVGIVEKVMNDGSIGSTFNEGHLTVTLYYLWDCWYLPNRQNKKSQSINLLNHRKKRGKTLWK